MIYTGSGPRDRVISLHPVGVSLFTLDYCICLVHYRGAPRLSLYREGRRGCCYGPSQFWLRVLVPITKPTLSLNLTGSAYFPMESELSCIPSSMSGRGPGRGLNRVGKEPCRSRIDNSPNPLSNTPFFGFHCGNSSVVPNFFCPPS
jgi:hypothetical protein